MNTPVHPGGPVCVRVNFAVCPDTVPVTVPPAPVDGTVYVPLSVVPDWTSVRVPLACGTSDDRNVALQVPVKLIEAPFAFVAVQVAFRLPLHCVSLMVSVPFALPATVTAPVNVRLPLVPELEYEKAPELMVNKGVGDSNGMNDTRPCGHPVPGTL